MLTLPICLPTREASKGLSKTINFVYREDILSPFIPWTQSFLNWDPIRCLSGP